MITIDQLLESVDLDFKPEFVTKQKDGLVVIWSAKPKILKATSSWENDFCEEASYPFLKLAEFEGKDWTECIYEVPRKTTGKTEKLKRHIEMDNDSARSCPPSGEEFMYKINELVDAVNELKERTEPKKLTGFAKTLSDLDMSKPMSTYTNKRGEE